MKEETRSYPRLQLSIFAGAFVFGVVMSSLGALLPSLSAAAGIGKADAGKLFFVMNLAMLIGSLLFGPICDRFGYRILLLGSTLLVAAAFGGLSKSHAYGPVLLSLAVLGLGGGALNGAANALLNDISPNRRQRALNLLGIFFGLGALFTPFAIGSLVGPAGLEGILVGLAILTLAPFFLFAAARFPEARHAAGFVWPELRALLGNPLLYVFGIVLFCESGNEMTAGGWISTYLGEELGMSQRAAAYVLAGYWGAMLLGRLAAIRVGGKVGNSSFVTAGASLAMAAAAGMILWRRPWLSSVCAILAGLGFSAIFPTVLAQVGAAFPKYSATVFSLVFVMALAGGMTAPGLVGRIAENRGVSTGLWVLVALCAGIILLQYPAARSGKGVDGGSKAAV